MVAATEIGCAPCYPAEIIRIWHKGRSIEGMASVIAEQNVYSLRDDGVIRGFVHISESEVVGLIHANASKADISKAIHDAIAGRIGSMIRRIGVNRDVVVVGGVGRNPGFMASMKRELKLDNIYVPEAPEFGSAVGAAIIAASSVVSQE